MIAKIFLSTLFTLFFLCFTGCEVSILIEDSTSSLWEEAYQHGENRVFITHVDSYYNQRVVWVSATGYPRRVVQESAQWRGTQILGRGAYNIDTRTEHLGNNTYRIDILMTAP